MRLPIDPATTDTDTLMGHIAALQDIQKREPSSHTAKWEAASQCLAPLFAEMARRQKAGENTDVRRGAK